MSEIQDAVYAFTDLGAHVLSPADPRVVDATDEFLFVASDQLRIVRAVQDRHLAAIAASDILWLVAPDGYVGASGAMEIGFGVASGTPIYGTHAPSDRTLSEYVQVVDGLEDALTSARTRGERDAIPSVLLDPKGIIDVAHRDLDVIEHTLTSRGSDGRGLAAAAGRLKKQVVHPLD